MALRMPRLEIRDPAKAELHVFLTEHPETRETVLVENFSPHGARALSSHPWHHEDRVVAKAVKGSFLALGRVVYCTSLDHGHEGFTIGIEFFFPSGDLEERT
jgi:hypothetical protein